MFISHPGNDKQNGSVLIIILFLIAVIAVISVMGYNAGALEISLAGNERCADSLKLNAESSALVCTQTLENIINETLFKSHTGHKGEITERILIDTSWNSPHRPTWLHKGNQDCVAVPENLRKGDINNDGRTTKDDGKTQLARARAFSRNYYLNDDIRMNDNWSPESCTKLTDSNGNPVPSMEKSKYMAVEYGIAQTESLKTGLTPMLKKKNYLITGVDEKCNGKYMVQIGYTGLVPISD